MQKIKQNISKLTCTQRALAEVLELTPARINQLIDEKIIVSDDRDTAGGVFLFDSLKNYFLSKNVKGTGVDYWKERGLNERAKRQMNELKLRQSEGELYAAVEVEKMVAEVLTTLRNNLLGLPSKYSAQLAGKSRAEIFSILTAEIDQQLEELARGFDS